MNARQKSLPLIAAVIAASSLAPAADFDLAAQATNKIAVDLYRQLATGDENLCLSPYSIQSALAMTFAGADGETRNEMARVLHFQGENDAIHASFDALRHSLAEITKKTETIAKESKKSGGPNEPITLAIANRLFAQDGYAFRDAFRALVRKFYGAPFEPLDFRKDPDGSARHINHWVAEQMRDRIRDLIPPGGVTKKSRLVLANAIYLKAPWQSEFFKEATKPEPIMSHGFTRVVNSADRILQ